jgi:hypothetical protein
VRLILAKECELRFFRRHCEDSLCEKRIEVGLSPCVFPRAGQNMPLHIFPVSFVQAKESTRI